MKIDFNSRICDNSLGELAEAFIQGHEMSNGMEFVSDNQLRKLWNVVNTTLHEREIGLIPD